ncbi:MAG: hypothetical protein IJE18_09205 [Bacteroidaceae bacterium]|nr:hypothetical protein [Bacteroidaceae bacterium]
MKKLIVTLALLFTFVLNGFAGNMDRGDQKSFLSGKVVVTNGGKYYEIVDNEKNVCIYIEIEEEKTSNGTFYNLMCENKTTKGIAKFALRGAIGTVVASTTASPTIAGLASEIAGSIYEEVCDYYGDK